MTPSKIKESWAMASVLQNSECETIAQNIAVILSRTGDTFRELPEAEYVSERKKDGGFNPVEIPHFNQVKDYFKSADTAKLFCPEYNKLLTA